MSITDDTTKAQAVLRAQGQGVLRKILEAACEERKSNLSRYTVLSKHVDPYRIDTASGHRDGAWLAEQLNRLYGQDRKAHWRGLHYAIVTTGNTVKPNGEIYRNTDEDWFWLATYAGKAARWLGYIPFERIRDQRNAPPIIHRRARVIPSAHISIGLDVDIPDADDIEPRPISRGFEVRQAFHFVIFGEKSSVEEAALPTARRCDADLYLPTGEISDTLVYQIAKEAAEDGRPLVMFTVSDCDPAGHQMPISIARKLQAFRDMFFPDLQFEVVPIALTAEQVREHGLPSTPLKETEKRGDQWRDAFGIEQTEIDALTTPANLPVLQQIIEDAFKPYLDPTLRRRVNEAEGEWNAAAQEAIARQIDDEHIAAIRSDAETKLEDLREQIGQINEQLDIVAGEHFTLPPINVPEPDIELDPDRPALVSFEDSWAKASQALIRHKAYAD